MSAPFVLGTAQLGSDYGINNRDGQPAYESARDIVETAWQLGVRQFDTARSYGDSEVILGRVSKELAIGSKLKVHTKWNLGDAVDAGTVKDLFGETLDRLGLDSIDTLYAHEFESFAAASGEVKAAIGELIAAGVLNQFAVSVYDPEQALAAMDDDLVSAIQIPGNAFDRRFEEAGFIAAARQNGIKVFVRSLYLQGLLVMSPEQIPERLSFAREAVAAWRAFCEERNLAPEAFALRYAKLKDWGTPVIGCESAQQVRENVELLSDCDAELESVVADWEGGVEWLRDSRISDPRQWPVAD